MLETITKMNVSQPSLRAIAEALKVPQQRLYSVAKQPIAGQVYDAKVYNWDAITRFVTKRIGADNPDGLVTLEDVINKALELDAQSTTHDKRRSSAGKGSGKAMMDVGDGRAVPERKFPIAIGQTVLLRNSHEVFKVVYLNEASVVLEPEGCKVLTCLSNWTLNQKMTNPANVTEEAIEATRKLKKADAAKAAEAAPAQEAPASEEAATPTAPPAAKAERRPFQG